MKKFLNGIFLAVCLSVFSCFLYSCSCNGKTNLRDTDITIIGDSSFVYCGEEIRPLIEVKKNNIIVDESNYSVSYTNNIDAGAATIIVSAKKDSEKFEGSKSIGFQIEKAIPQFEIPTNIVASYGKTLGDISLPNGFSFEQDLSAFVGDVGERQFQVKYTPSDSKNFKTVHNIEINVSVNVAVNLWTSQLSIQNWTYGENPKLPSISSKFGSAKFVYSKNVDSGFSEEVPKNAGIYYIKAYVDSTSNYSGISLTNPVLFEIKKGIPNVEIPTKIFASYGQTIDEIELPDGFSFDQTMGFFDTLGTVSGYTLSYTPSDLLNYETKRGIVVDIEVGKREVEILWCEDDFTFNGLNQKESVTAKFKDINNNDVGLAVTSPSEFKNYNEQGYNFTVSLNNDYYKLPEIVNKIYHIKKYVVTIDWTEDNFIYDGTNQKQKVKASFQNVLDNKINLTVSGQNSFKDYKENGYDFSASFSNEMSNYALPEDNTKTYFIQQKELSISGITAGTRQYDGGTKASLFLSNATITGIVPQDNVSIIAYGDFEDKNVGNNKRIYITEYVINGYDKANYKMSETGKQTETTGTITQRVVSFTFFANGGTYGKEIIPASVTLKNIISSDVVNPIIFYSSLDYSKSEILPSNAGEYDIAIELDNNNYQINQIQDKFVIEKQVINVPTINSKAWTGENLVAEIELSTLFDIIENNGGTDVGSYDVILRLKDNKNYKWSTSGSGIDITLSFVISSAINDWVVIPTISNYCYGETANPIGSASYGSVVFKYKKSQEDDSCYTVEAPQNVGSYVMKAYATTAGYGDLISSPVSFVITPRNISGAEITLGSRLFFNGTEQTQNISSVIIDSLNVDTYEITDNKATNYNPDGYYLTVTASGNFTGSATKLFNINKKVVEINWVEANAVYNGTNQQDLITANFFDIEDNVIDLDVELIGETEFKNYKSSGYTFKSLFVSSQLNYELPSNNTHVYYISKLEVNIQASDGSMIYGDEEITNLSWIYCNNSNKFLDQDNISPIVITNANSQSNVLGNYYTRIKDIENENYDVGCTDGQFIIYPKDISLATIVLGETLIYNGQEQFQSVLSVTINNLDVTFDVTNNNATNVADEDYVLTVSGKNNFCGFATKAFNIAKKVIDVIWCEDDFTYNGLDQKNDVLAYYKDVENNSVYLFTYQGSIQESDTYKFDDYKPIGYTFYVAFNQNETNYSLPTNISKKFNIKQKEIVVSNVCAIEKIYDGNTNVWLDLSNVILEGKVEGDALRVTVSGIFEDECAGNNKKVYLSINELIDADKTNYKLALSGQQSFALANILPKSISVEFNVEDKVYSAQNVSFAAIASGNLNDEDVEFSFLYSGKNETIYNSEVGPCDVGDYNVSLTIKNKNYYFAGQNEDFKILQKQVTISNLLVDDKVYDNLTTAQINYTNLKIEGNLDGSDLTVTAVGNFVDVNANNNIVVNVTNITLQGSKAKNYKLSSSNQIEAHASILKAYYDMSNITFSDKSYVYDSLSHSLEIKGTLPTGLDLIAVTVNYSGQATNVSDGEVEVVATFSTLSGNYHIPESMTAKVKITQRDIAGATITLENNLTYNGESQEQLVKSVVISGLYVTFTVSDNIQRDHCNSSYYLTVSGTDNFKGTETKSFNIAKKAITISGVSAGDKIYDRNKSATLNYENIVYGGIIGEDELTFSAEGLFENYNAGYVKVLFSNIVLGGNDILNYKLSSLSQTYTYATISKKEISSNITISDKIFDAESVSASATFNDVISPDTINYQFTYSARQGSETSFISSTTGPINVGEYTVEVSINETNYSLSKTTKDFEITKKNIQNALVTLGSQLTYNGANQTQSVSSVEIDSLVATFDISNNTQKNAGNYSLTVTGNGNFEGSTTKQFNILKKDITVSNIKANSKTYDGKTDVVLNYNDRVLSTIETGDDVDIIAEGSFANANAGNNKQVNIFNLTLTGDDCENYNLVTSSLVAHANIDKKEITTTIVSNGGTYGNVLPATAQFVGIIEGESVSPIISYSSQTYSSSTNLPINAGVYTITVSTSNGNYLITGENTETFEIEKKIVSVSGIEAENKNYDRTQTATLKYDNVIFDGIVSNDNLSISAVGIFEDVNVGNVKVLISNIVLSGADSQNYELSPSNQTYTYADILKKAITSTISINDKVFDNQTAVAAVNFAGIISPDTINYSITYSAKEGSGTSFVSSTTGPINVGEYTVEVSINETNYSLSKTTKDFEITKKNIQNATVTLGSQLTYNGTNQIQSVSSVEIDSLVVTFDISNNTQKDAGNYSLTVTGNGNFEGSSTKNFEIFKKDVSVSGITCGNKIYDGNSNATFCVDLSAVSFDGIISGDVITISTYNAIFVDNLSDKNPQSDVGNYYVYISNITLDGNDKDNYNFTNGEYDGELQASITKATLQLFDLTLTNLDDLTVNYTGSSISSMQDRTPSVLIESNSQSALTISYSQTQSGEYSLTAPSFTNVGEYTIYFKLTFKNYNDVISSFAFEIESVNTNLTLNLQAENRAYNAQPFIVSHNELPENVQLIYSYSGTTLSGATYSSSTAPTDAGTYTVSVSLPTNSNYVITDSTTKDFTISKYSLLNNYESSISIEPNVTTFAEFEASFVILGSPVDKSTLTWEFYYFDPDGPFGQYETAKGAENVIDSVNNTYYYKAVNNNLELHGSITIPTPV